MRPGQGAESGSGDSSGNGSGTGGGSGCSGTAVEWITNGDNRCPNRHEEEEGLVQCPFMSTEENAWMEHVDSCAWSQLQTCKHCMKFEGWEQAVEAHEVQCGSEPEPKRAKTLCHRPAYNYGICAQHEGVTRAVSGGYRFKLYLQRTQVYSQGFRTSQGGHGTDGWIGGFVRNSVSIK